jgi:hypothetical protein
MNEIVLSLRTKNYRKNTTKIRNRTTRWVMARPEDRIVQYLTREKNFFCLIPLSGPSSLVYVGWIMMVSLVHTYNNRKHLNLNRNKGI